MDMKIYDWNTKCAHARCHGRPDRGWRLMYSEGITMIFVRNFRSDVLVCQYKVCVVVQYYRMKPLFYVIVDIIVSRMSSLQQDSTEAGSPFHDLPQWSRNQI